jgi:hypothetical protein
MRIVGHQAPYQMLLFSSVSCGSRMNVKEIKLDNLTLLLAFERIRNEKESMDIKK